MSALKKMGLFLFAQERSKRKYGCHHCTPPPQSKNNLFRSAAKETELDQSGILTCKTRAFLNHSKKTEKERKEEKKPRTLPDLPCQLHSSSIH